MRSSKAKRVGGLAVWQDRASGLWIVRDCKSLRELAHEPTKAGALRVARAYQSINTAA